MDLIAKLGLERVRALWNPSVQVIWLVDREIVRADGCHCQPANFATDDATCQLYTLAVVLNLGKMVMVSAWLCHYFIVPCCNATISSKWLWMTHMLSSSCRGGYMLLSCLGRFASTTTSTFLCQEGIGHSSHYFTAHFFVFTEVLTEVYIVSRVMMWCDWWLCAQNYKFISKPN